MDTKNKGDDDFPIPAFNVGVWDSFHLYSVNLGCFAELFRCFLLYVVYELHSGYAYWILFSTQCVHHVVASLSDCII